ncbi:amidohydrolase [Variovorax sp.]|jgi:predicted amidohydrolase YtcJ|uniref:amidohydrolase n=1 Tax=Variovorax sp. TaxID=1871043 RepID=UPI0025E77962|nr:amidohydrolase [Variovorax sp.]
MKSAFFQGKVRSRSRSIGAALLLAVSGMAMVGCSGGGGNGGLEIGASVPPAPPAQAAQLIYKNGTVLTLDENNSVAQAVAISDGRILAVGASSAIEKHIGSATRVVDLAGRTLIPGIYDAHSHLVFAGTNLLFEADLNSPPIGPVQDLSQLLSVLEEQRAKLGPDAWITGFGYDDTLLAEKRHPTRADLDRVSATQPILITHVSGHLAVANSVALALAGIDAATSDPSGGVIRKDASGEPDGVLEETAVQMVGGLKPPLTAAQVQAATQAISALYASRGVTTASDGASGADGIKALEAAAQAGDLAIRVVALPTSMSGLDTVDLKSRKVKIGGIKTFADGSIQGYTGYLGQPYHTPFHGDASYRGFPRADREALAQQVLGHHKAGRQLLVHGNGDAAIDDILHAFRRAQEEAPRSNARHTVIHSQTVREDQLDEMKRLNVIPSYFILHTYYWGDRHRDVFLGPARAERISPARSTADRGMVYTIHADTPVVPMDPMRLIWAAVNRVSTSGAVIGPAQRVSAIDALRATTINAAYQNFEEKERGSIEVGKWADLVLLSANPVAVDPSAIKDIRVLETVLEGKTVYRSAD